MVKKHTQIWSKTYTGTVKKNTQISLERIHGYGQAVYIDMVKQYSQIWSKSTHNDGQTVYPKYGQKAYTDMIKKA